MLAVMILLQHLRTIFQLEQISVSAPLNIVVLIFTILYFWHLKSNLSSYFLLDNIKLQTIIISITYSIVYLLGPVLQILSDGKPIKNMPQQYKTISIILMLLISAALIIQIIQYILLARKLVRYQFNILVRRLGYSFYIWLLSIALTLTFILIKPIKPYGHIFILLEVLPLWFTYKIYKEIKNDKIGREIDTSAHLPDINKQPL